MKAVLLTGHGGFEKLAYREDVAEPKPRSGEVLIKVGAAGINNTDIWTREGAYGSADDPNAISGYRREPMVFPRIQGGDIAGTIVATGQGVPQNRVGERVLVNPTLYADDANGLYHAGYIGSERDGGFAEYAAVPAENAVAIESPLSDAELATFPTAYLTAEAMLERARLSHNETILITGASGGVGSALIQLAAIRRARIIAVVGAGKERIARELGARTVITRGCPTFVDAVRGETDSGNVDVVADVVAGPMFPALLNLLRPGGRYVTAGAIAGPMVTLDLRTVYLKHLKLIGSTLGTKKEFLNLVGYIESGKVKPLLAKTYRLNEIQKAQQDFQKKAFFGKLVLLPTAPPV